MALTGASRLAPVPLRLAVGATCIYYGYETLFGEKAFDAFIQRVTDLGLPRPEILAQVAAWGALAGGIMLILGFATRIAALLNGATIGVMLWKINLGGDVSRFADVLQNNFNPADGSGYLTPLVLLLACLSLVLTGPGALSLDSLLTNRKSRVEPS